MNRSRKCEGLRGSAGASLRTWLLLLACLVCFSLVLISCTDTSGPQESTPEGTPGDTTEGVDTDTTPGADTSATGEASSSTTGTATGSTGSTGSTGATGATETTETTGATDETGTAGTTGTEPGPDATGATEGTSATEPVVTDPTETTTGEEETTGTEADPDHPGDASLYDGLMIAKVYGTGKKNTDASISHGFVQLYNANDTSMSLRGASLYYKSDGAKPYEQLVFPDDAVVPAKGFYLIRANSPAGYDETCAILSVEACDLEWDIYIDNKEVRLLLAPSGWVIPVDADIVEFRDAISVFYASETYKYSVMATSKLSKDRVAVRTALTGYSGYHTVKLSEAATGELNQLRTVTSTGEINPVLGSRLNEVGFSHDAGIYESTVSLKLTAAPGYSIFYTTDGSDPTTSTTRKKYTETILLSDSSAMAWGSTIKRWMNQAGTSRPTSSTLPGGYVIKAYATNGTDATEVYTNTYFIVPDLASYGVSVISISIPLLEMLGPDGFYSNYCPTNVITDPRPRGTAMMEVFDPVTGQRVGHSVVELAISGNGSSGWAMKSMRIYYKGANNQGGGLESDLDYDLFGGTALNSRGEAITSFSRLLLRNSGNDCHNSYIRDAYMQSTSAGLNVDTMASASTLVFINGEFWGVYNIRERYSPEYVESHYGIDKDNVTLIESDYSQVHTNTNADFVLSSGEEGDQDPFNQMIEYMRTHDLADSEAYAIVCDQMDIDSFIDLWVARLFYVARDWPENNIKVWRNKNPEDPSGLDTKWHFTLLDMDMGLSFYDFTTESENFFWAFNSNSVCGTMMRSLMRNEGFKNKFILRYYEVFKEYYTPEFLKEAFDALYLERTALMPLQVARWGNEGASMSTWNNAVGRIRSFIQNRQSIALQHMYGYFGIRESDLDSLSCKRVTVSFNNARGQVTVNGTTVENGQIFKFTDDNRAFTVKATANDGFTITSIVWTGVDGKEKKVDVDGTTAQAVFIASCSGTISVYVKRLSSGGDAVSGGTLVAGASYAFYLDGNGDLYAWGDNRGGALGLDSQVATVTTPTFVMGNVAKVSTTTSADVENGSTNWSTAILTKDGKLYTVGANGSGQLGRSGTSADARLGAVRFSGKIVDVSMGYDHMLVLDDQGVLWGVGNNSYGQLGTSAGSSTTTFVKVATHVALISAGRRSTLYVDENGTLYGLGDNRWNKMVAGGPDRLTQPTQLLQNVEFISSGEHEMVAVTANGVLYYAGWRNFDSFSQGGGNDPALRKVMSGVSSASIYFSDLVILTTKGEAYVYGFNQGGAIGSQVVGGVPKKFITNVTSVAAGYAFTAYLTEDGRILIQGDNSYGQAGNGTTGVSVNCAEADI